MELVSKPTWEDIDELFKADGLRQFRIDIEADSHIEPDMLAARRDMTEFAGAFGKLIGESLPIVQAAPPFGKIIAVAAKKMCRTYEFGREMEDVIDKVMGEIAGMPPTPPPGAEKVNKGKSPEELAIMAASVENDKTKNQIAAAGVQADAQNSAADAQTNAASVAAELERTKSAERIAALEASVEKMKAMVEAMTRHHEATKDADTRLEEAAAAERAAKASKPEGVT